MGFTDPAFLHNFWPNFWSSIAANFIVGVVIVGFISWVRARSKKIEARIFVDIVHLSETEYLLVSHLRNTGKVAFKSDEIYWNLFVDSELQLEEIMVPEAEPNFAQTGIKIQDKLFHRFASLCSSPVFPGRQVEPIGLRVKASQIEKVRMYYFLSTAYGLFPKHVQIDAEADNNISSKFFKTLGIVETRVKERAT